MLEVSILAPIIEFFLQLNAMERYLVTIQMKNRTWAMYRATRQNGETCFVPSFGSNLRRASFTISSYFVAVGSSAAHVGLL